MEFNQPDWTGPPDCPIRFRRPIDMKIVRLPGDARLQVPRPIQSARPIGSHPPDYSIGARLSD